MGPSPSTTVAHSDDTTLHTKRCTKCAAVKPFAEFHANGALRDGRAVWCRPCCSAYSKARTARDPATYRTYNRERYHTSRASNPVRVWSQFACAAAKKRAAAKGLPFAITSQYLESIATDTCPALGLVLDYTGKGRAGFGNVPDSASVDRVAGAAGYVPGNVRVVSMKANLIKQDATADEIRAVADYCDRELHHPAHKET